MLTQVYFGLQHYTSRLPCSKLHARNRSHVAGLKIIVGLHLLPSKEFLLGVGARSSDKITEDVSVLYLRPASHVRDEFVLQIQTVGVILESEAYRF